LQLSKSAVSFQLPERVIAVNQQNSCPVASQVYVHLANEVRRLPPIVATQSLEYHQKWVSQQDPVAELGSYGVLHVEYFPGQFVSRLSQRDHRIVIVGIHQNVAPPPVVLPPAPRQEVAPQRPEVSLDAESKWLLTSLLDRFRYFQEILTRFRDFLNTLPLG
jgi:hypothetical protein